MYVLLRGNYIATVILDYLDQTRGHGLLFEICPAISMAAPEYGVYPNISQPKAIVFAVLDSIWNDTFP